MGLEVNRFVNSGEINEDLICNICKGVLEEGVWAPTCEHAFCKVCINQWLLRRSVCPNDRQPLSTSILKPIPRFMRNLLEKLQIKCDFASNGCQQVFHLEAIRNHTNICDFNPEKRVECLSGCGLVIRKADLPNHSCIKCLRKVISDNSRRHESSVSALNSEITFLRNESQKFKTLLNGLQNDVKRLLADKQMTVISSANSQASSSLISSIPTIHKSSDRSVGRLSVPNPFVLITPLTSISSTYSSSSYDEPSSSTLSSATTSRLSNEEPAFKRRTTTIRVATPTIRDPRLLGNESDHFYQNPMETTIYSRSPSPNQSGHQYMRRAINLSLSNDSNSEDESTALTVSDSLTHSNNYITLEDHEFDANEDTEEEEASFGIIEDYEVEIQTPD